MAPALSLACACATLIAADAAAQARGAPTEAIEHFERGRAHFQAGRYEEAIEELEQAAALDPGSPVLSYNLGRVHELAGKLSQALEYYERYIALLPESQVRQRAEGLAAIQRVEGALESGLGETSNQDASADWLEQAREREREHELELARTRALRPPPVASAGGSSPLFWIAAVLSGLCVASGALLGVLALQEERAALDYTVAPGSPLGGRNRLANNADNYALTADVLFIGSAVFALGATVVYYVLPRSPDEAHGDDDDDDDDDGRETSSGSRLEDSGDEDDASRDEDGEDDERDGAPSSDDADPYIDDERPPRRGGDERARFDLTLGASESAVGLVVSGVL